MHLEEIAFHVAPGAHAVLILDQAGWHGSAELVVPPNITLMPLPPRRPELNPVENVWQFMRDNWLSNRISIARCQFQILFLFFTVAEQNGQTLARVVASVERYGGCEGRGAPAFRRRSEAWPALPRKPGQRLVWQCHPISNERYITGKI